MTYFSYKRLRGTRSEAVYTGATLLGRVTVRADWRSRIGLGGRVGDLYCAIGLGGEALPGLFPSRHDAAEALYDAARRQSVDPTGWAPD